MVRVLLFVVVVIFLNAYFFLQVIHRKEVEGSRLSLSLSYPFVMIKSLSLKFCRKLHRVYNKQGWPCIQL